MLLFISWELKFRSVSLRVGYIGNICWAFLFFPVTRGSSLLPLIGLTSESSIKYHIWLGHLSNLLFALHTIGFIIYWALTHQLALVISSHFLCSLVHQFWLFNSSYIKLFEEKKRVVFIFLSAKFLFFYYLRIILLSFVWITCPSSCPIYIAFESDWFFQIFIKDF